MSTAPNYPRPLKQRIAEAMMDTPVVLVTGPRQAGKTTLVRELASPQQRYITLDDELTLQAARNDPVGMIRGLDRAIIDEVQRAPELLLAIKKSVDEDRRPGRFLLTGSANLMLLPKVADSLAGRMETLTLLPLSQSEIQGGTTNWLDSVFADVLLDVAVPLIGDALTDTVLRGGYPEAVSRATPRRRATWARQYVDALIQRDVNDIAEVGRLHQLPQFLAGLAQTAGQLCNYSQLGGQMGMDHKTASRYIGVFEQMFLLDRIAPWASNRLSRIVKTPKLQFIDSGLLAALLELTPTLVQQDRTGFGHVLESFVYGELRKHAASSEGRYRLSFYRDHDQLEVDLVLENSRGQLIGVEVKASATVRAADFRGLKQLATLSGDKFKMGVILYDGTQTLSFGDRLWIAPISTLWGKAPATLRQ